MAEINVSVRVLERRLHVRAAACVSDAMSEILWR
jgi:hypothetical protein